MVQLGQVFLSPAHSARSWDTETDEVVSRLGPPAPSEESHSFRRQGLVAAGTLLICLGRPDMRRVRRRALSVPSQLRVKVISWEPVAMAGLGSLVTKSRVVVHWVIRGLCCQVRGRSAVEERSREQLVARTPCSFARNGSRCGCPSQQTGRVVEALLMASRPVPSPTPRI